MVDHGLFIHWAFERHCKQHLNSDFEVCDDPACQVAIEFEQAAQQAGAVDASPQATGSTSPDFWCEYCKDWVSVPHPLHTR